MKCIADTGVIVAFANRRDANHEWAIALAAELDGPMLTCEAVLAEAAFHLRDVPYVLSLLDSELIALDFDLRANTPAVNKLAKRYRDRKPDLADLCLIRMSELHPKRVVVTVDVDDFSIYRRNGREHIPLLTP